MQVQEIRTPALLVDLDAMESNLNRMAAFFRDKPVKLRPHFKNHKVPLLAWKQIEAGAIGVCCATLREAEILVQHGIRSILVANEISTEDKIHWFADMSRHADIMVAVDDERVVADMACIARKRRLTLSVLVDCNVGLNRCGVPPGEPACRLAKIIVEQGLRFRGLMGYEGHLQALPAGEERDRLTRIVGKSLRGLQETLIERKGSRWRSYRRAGTGTLCASRRLSWRDRNSGGFISAHGHDLCEPRIRLPAQPDHAGKRDQPARSAECGSRLRNEGIKRRTWFAAVERYEGASEGAARGARIA